MRMSDYERQLERDMIKRKVKNITKPLSQQRRRLLFHEHTLSKDEKTIWLSTLMSSTIEDWSSMRL